MGPSKIILAIVIGCVLLFIILTKLFPDKKEKKPSNSSLDELEKKSEELVETKKEIRAETEQTEKIIEKINNNLKK